MRFSAVFAFHANSQRVSLPYVQSFTERNDPQAGTPANPATTTSADFCRFNPSSLKGLL
jgi:hypothetical protein